MRTILTLLALLLPGVAMAHPGHLNEADGHQHFIAAWALLAAITGSVWLIWTELRSAKGAKVKRAEDDEAGA
jgi:type VI protein secretion system component VasK